MTQTPPDKTVSATRLAKPLTETLSNFFSLQFHLKVNSVLGKGAAPTVLDSDMSYLSMKKSFKSPTTITIMSCCLQDQFSSKRIPMNVSKQRPGATHTTRTSIYTCAPNCWCCLLLPNQTVKVHQDPQGPSLASPAQQFLRVRTRAANCFQGLDSHHHGYIFSSHIARHFKA